MGNIFDYLEWRDIDLKKVEFNVIDSLILSRMSYLPFDGLIEENEKITISECFERYEIVGERGNILMQNDVKLFPVLANSKRFGNLYVSDYINRIEEKNNIQFSAISVLLPDNTIAVVFRGTDASFVGWKEDLNMSFSTAVPSQLDAVKYLEKMYYKYKKNIRIIGHSKGGNLAIYSSVFCNRKVKKKILDVYNFDGPGFLDKVIDSEEYSQVIDKIHNYIPQSSVVGRMLKHKGELTVIKSTEKGIMQHDLYSWDLLGDRFIESELTNSSEFIDKALTEWLENVSPEQRENFVNTLFEILEATGAKNFFELNQNKFASAKAMITKYQSLDDESKKYINKALNMFLVYGKESFSFKKKTV